MSADSAGRELPYLFPKLTLDFFQTYPIFFPKLTLDFLLFSATAPAIQGLPRQKLYWIIGLFKGYRTVYTTCGALQRWRRDFVVSAARTSGTYPRLFPNLP
jgi:hypothetical protein